MTTPRVVEVVTEVAPVDRAYSYVVPEGMDVGVGDRVRVNFNNRSVRGWIVSDDTPFDGTLELKPLVKWLGYGPHPRLLPLLVWASQRYVSVRKAALAAASPTKLITTLPTVPHKAPLSPAAARDEEPLEPGLWHWSPTHDPLGLVLHAYERSREREGSLLVLTPTDGWAARLTERLRARGIAVTHGEGEWDRVRAGWPVVVGARGAVFAPCGRVSGVVVLDADDESYVSESSPTWNAVTIGVERARRDDAPIWLTTTLPSPALCVLGLPIRREDDLGRGWPRVVVEDRRATDPRDGVLSQGVLALARAALASDAKVAVTVVLQRLGGGRLYACKRCGDVPRCPTCEAADVVDSTTTRLVCSSDTSHVRDAFCRGCGSIAFRVVRSGVTTLARDVSLQLGVPVATVTAASPEVPAGVRVVAGTEAVFTHVRHSGLVVFVDFDQYLLAPREEARRDAVHAVARAGRMVGVRGATKGTVVVQTRRGDDDVLRALHSFEFSALIDDEVETARTLQIPPFVARAEIGGAGGAEYARRLRDAGVHVRARGNLYLVDAATNDDLRAELAKATRPAGAMRLAIS